LPLARKFTPRFIPLFNFCFGFSLGKKKAGFGAGKWFKSYLWKANNGFYFKIFIKGLD